MMKYIVWTNYGSEGWQPKEYQDWESVAGWVLEGSSYPIKITTGEVDIVPLDAKVDAKESREYRILEEALMEIIEFPVSIHEIGGATQKALQGLAADALDKARSIDEQDS